MRNRAILATLLVLSFLGPSEVRAVTRESLRLEYRLGRGFNIINIPLLKTSGGAKWKASEILAVTGGSMLLSFRPKHPQQQVGFIADPWFPTRDFEVDPRQSYNLLSGWAHQVEVFGYGPLDTYPSVGAPVPAYRDPMLNSWGFPNGVPYLMTYEDVRTYPQKTSGDRPGMYILTTEVDELTGADWYMTPTKLALHAQGWPNKLVRPGQGFFVWLWALQAIDSRTSLPTEGDDGMADVATTVGRSSTSPGAPATDYTDAKDTPMNDPQGVRALSAGDPEKVVYADTGNSVIRRTIREGVSLKVTRVAGIDGVSTYNPLQDEYSSGALNTYLNHPRDVEFDTRGNFYIADTGNNIIRTVDTSGKIHRIAGKKRVPGHAFIRGDGQRATDAQFDTPQSLALVGNQLYVVDRTDGRVRRFSVSGDTNPLISTYSGGVTTQTSEEGLSAQSVSYGTPERIAADGIGSLYITDSLRGNVRKIQNDVVTTLIGATNQTSPSKADTGTPRLFASSQHMREPRGVAVAHSGVLIGDHMQGKIFRVGGVEKLVSGIAGFGSIVENPTQSLAAYTAHADATAMHCLDGVVTHFSDSGANRIRRLVKRP